MKKLLQKRALTVFLLTAAVFLIYGALLLIDGDRISLYVNFNADCECRNAGVLFGNDAAESEFFEVKEITVKKNYARAQIKAHGKGTEQVALRVDLYKEGEQIAGTSTVETLTAGAFHIITNNVSRHIYLVLTALCLLLFLYYSYCFVTTVRTKRFSYQTIFFLSVGLIFLLITAVWSAGLLYSFVNSHSTYSPAVYEITRNLMTAVIFITAPLMLVFIVSVSVSNIVLMKREGFRPANTLGIITSAAMLAGLAAVIVLLYLDRSLHSAFFSAVYAAASSLFVMFEVMLFSAEIYGIYASKYTPAYDKDCIIILGCKIKDDGTLYPLIRGRADKAVEFFRKQKEATGKEAYFIPSGGQGDDEVMAEAEAIRLYLLEQGIPDRLILPETRSTTTKENMEFSKEIIDQLTDNAKVVFSTTGYHVFRSGAIAYDNGIRADGIGSKTKWYFWPNAFLREVAGIFVSQPKKQILLIALTTLAAGAGSFIYSML